MWAKPLGKVLMNDDPRNFLAPENLGEFKHDWCRQNLGMLDDTGMFIRNGITYRVIVVENDRRPKPVQHNPVEPSPLDEGKKPPRHGPSEGLISRLMQRFGK